MTDIECTWTHSFATLAPRTGKGSAWLEKHISMAAYLNGAFAVEHRFLAEIVYAARGAGLTVETTN